MNEQDQKAFESKFGKEAHKSIFELSTYELRKHAWQAALEYARGQQEPVAWVDSVMEQAQVFASAWSLVGGRFDDGSGLENAETEKARLRSMLTTPPAPVRLTDEAKKWKSIAEFLYAKQRYPDKMELGEGALDAYADKWTSFEDAVALERKRGGV